MIERSGNIEQSAPSQNEVMAASENVRHTNFSEQIHPFALPESVKTGKIAEYSEIVRLIAHANRKHLSRKLLAAHELGQGIETITEVKDLIQFAHQAGQKNASTKQQSDFLGRQICLGALRENLEAIPTPELNETLATVTYLSKYLTNITYVEERALLPMWAVTLMQAPGEREATPSFEHKVRHDAALTYRQALLLSAIIRRCIHNGLHMIPGDSGGFVIEEVITRSALVRDCRGQRNSRKNKYTKAGGAELTAMGKDIKSLCDFVFYIDDKPRRFIKSYDPKTNTIVLSEFLTNVFRDAHDENSLKGLKPFNWAAFKRSGTTQLIVQDKRLSDDQNTVEYSVANPDLQKKLKLPAPRRCATGGRTYRETNKKNERILKKCQLAPLSNSSKAAAHVRENAHQLITRKTDSTRQAMVSEHFRISREAMVLVSEFVLNENKIPTTAALTEALRNLLVSKGEGSTLSPEDTLSELLLRAHQHVEEQMLNNDRLHRRHQIAS